MLLSKAKEGFLLARRADGLSENTTALDDWTIKKLILYFNDPEVNTITTADLRRFLLHYETIGFAPASLDNLWKAIRSFYKWSSVEIGSQRPDLVIQQPKYKPREIIPYTMHDIDALLKAVDKVKTTQKRNRAIILTLLDTGIRVGECCRLKIEDVNMETGEIIINAFGTGRKTKGRRVYIGKSAKKAIWLYLSERGKLYPEEPLFEANNRPIENSVLKKIINRIGERASVKNSHPHRFRHTFAIEYLRNGGDVFTLQRILGHSTLTMVKHYIALSDTDTQTAHRKASPADKWKL